MPNTSTIARPYAKAIFEHALTAKQLSQWSEILQTLSIAVQDKEAKQFIESPNSTVGQQVVLLMAFFAKSDSETIIENLLKLLAQNKRLMILPDIKLIFETLRADEEKTLIVNVFCYSEPTTDQQAKLIESLSHRLQRQITLNLKIDKSLLGGAIIQAGDLVINGSVREKLAKLSTDLAA